MVVNKNGGSGTGVLAAAIDVASSCCAAYSSPWTLRLVTNGDGVVQSGSLNGAAGKYVLGKGGKINFLTTGSTTTLVTDTPIPAMRGTETPTTIKINITGKR